MKLAAIDIGSNAARLLISEVTEIYPGKPEFIKASLVRVPLRLGFDVFETGRISDVKIEKVIKTIRAYKLLLDVYEVQHLNACATSAMRDATNSVDILNTVKAQTGIVIKVISGQEEASLIYENHIAENLNNHKSYLYIDVGGGSTELSFFSTGRLVAKESFNIGTIRLLKNQVQEETWAEMKNFIRINIKTYHPITCIGSGGNINKIFSLSKRKEGQTLNVELLYNYYKEFNSLSLAQRMSLYSLREDRADVIVPALLIFINIMKWAESNEIFVPKIGLADGLIHHLYDEITQQKAPVQV
ncbi:MAG: Ppx/GppA phosphatase family protein [Chitinophagaceae bacterium]